MKIFAKMILTKQRWSYYDRFAVNRNGPLWIERIINDCKKARRITFEMPMVAL